MGNCAFPGCTTRLNRYNQSEFCSIHEGLSKHLTGELEPEVKLAYFAKFYDYSYLELRRFKEHVREEREPIVLGVSYVGSGQYVFHCEPGIILGPLPGGETRTLLPPNTKSAVPFCSGLQSGLPSVGALHLGKKHCEVTVSVEPCHSGKMVQVFYHT